MEIKLKRLHENAMIPTYTTGYSSCAELYVIEDLTIEPGETKIIRSGWAMEAPYGFSIHIYPRRGLSAGHELIMLNSVSIIDWDYRGEVICDFKNIGKNPVVLRKGDRFAKMRLKRLDKLIFEEVEELSTRYFASTFS